MHEFSYSHHVSQKLPHNLKQTDTMRFGQKTHATLMHPTATLMLPSCTPQLPSCYPYAPHSYPRATVMQPTPTLMLPSCSTQLPSCTPQLPSCYPHAPHRNTSATTNPHNYPPLYNVFKVFTNASSATLDVFSFAIAPNTLTTALLHSNIQVTFSQNWGYKLINFQSRITFTLFINCSV
jgi:hypothetical protein